MRRKVVSGFTLIEMLVVIAIIGVLVAMLVPALGKARERAWSTQCKAKLKNLHVASMNYFYAAHHLPYARSWEEPELNVSGTYTWHERVGWCAWLDWETHTSKTTKDSDLRPGIPGRWWGSNGRASITNGALWDYVGQTYKAYLCPVFRREEICGETMPADPLPYDPLRSYVMNSSAGGIDIGDLKDASRRLMFADGGVLNQTTDGEQVCLYNLKDVEVFDSPRARASYDAELACTPYGNEDYPMENVGDYHSGKANVVFIDGHTEQVSWDRAIDACAGNW